MNQYTSDAPITIPRADITKFLLSTPARFQGRCRTEWYYLMEAHENRGKMTYSSWEDERTFRQYIELAVLTRKMTEKELIFPDYSALGESFAVAMSVLFGKRFEFHGITQQHGFGYVPLVDPRNTICNKNLCFNSSTPRADYGIAIDLANFTKIENLLLEQEDNLRNAQSTFFYAGRFYLQSLNEVEKSPEIAFISLITSVEILASYFKYRTEDLLDEDTYKLLLALEGIDDIGPKLASKVRTKVLGISEGLCKFMMESLDDQFFERSESKRKENGLKKADIKRRIKAAYDIRSKIVHAGKFHRGWMQVNYLDNNDEIMYGDPVIDDKDIRKSISRSPTFIGMERMVRYSLIKFLLRTRLVESLEWG